MYVDTRTQTWPCSPGINVATHKNQSCCLSWCSCFAECGSKSTLMSGGAGVAPRVLYAAAVCAYVFALLVAVKVQPRMLAAEQHGHPCTFWNVPLAGPFLGLWACMFFVFLHCVLCMWNQHPGTKRKKTWMKNNLSQLNAFLQKAKKRIYHGRKIGATNLEAGLLIFVLWPQFWVQNLAPVLGPQSANRNYSIRAANVLLPLQADSSTYPWYCMYLYIHIRVPNIYIYIYIYINK